MDLRVLGRHTFPPTTKAATPPLLHRRNQELQLRLVAEFMAAGYSLFDIPFLYFFFSFKRVLSCFVCWKLLKSYL